MGNKHVLFVCTANELRSPTAEDFFRKDDQIDVKSAGTHTYANQQINEDLIKWSDLIIVMEDHHKEKIIERFPNLKTENIIVLGIPDRYSRNDPELIKILEKKVPPHLNRLLQRSD